jgi:ligand-binding sensor domain-containing protein
MTGDRPGPEPARRIIAAGQVVLGFIIVAGLIAVVLFGMDLYQEQTLPEGCVLVRPPGEVTTLLIDGDVVWTGGKDGVILVDRITRGRLPLPPGTPAFGYVRDLFSDSTGAIWVAHDGGLARYTEEGWTDFSPDGDILTRGARSVLEVGEDTFWVGTPQGITALAGGTWQHVPLPEEAVSADVLFRASDGTVWVGSSSPTRGVLLHFTGGEWEQYSLSDGLPHRKINQITEDSEGEVWVATGFASQGGAACFHNGTWTSITTADGLPGGSIRSIYVDRDGRVWIGSEYDGIAFREKDRWIVLTRREGIAGNEVKEMVQDRSGAYWLGTDRGLSVIRSISAIIS